jgi:hypothetical protein
MLEALVIAGIVAAPLGSAALFLPHAAARDPSGARAWPAIRRFLLAIVGTVALAAAAAAILKVFGATNGNLEAGAVGLAAASVAWLPVTRRWSARAHLCWASSTFLFRGLPRIRA